MFARILVPLDGSPLAEVILPTGAGPTRIHGAEILLLRVARSTTSPAWMPPMPTFMLRKKHRGMPVR